ncbi:MAG: GrpB family protein [Gemmataceae bacterium]|nr:GrpB family protein [Planctomycetia bacterium]MBX3401165.1 GrpB family protein [Gemmataceae bacterium]
MPKPVELVPYSAEWPATAEREIGRLVHALHGLVVVGHHIGSTAVPGLSAKPVVDLLLVVRGVAELDDREAAFRHLGYRCRGENGIAGRRYYTLDDTRTGRRQFQVHCFGAGSREIERHLAFRDYLRTHPDTARAYEAAKQRCRELHPEDSNAYCDAKASWIAGVLPLALAHFAGRAVVGGSSSVTGNGDGGIDLGKGG